MKPVFSHIFQTFILSFLLSFSYSLSGQEADSLMSGDDNFIESSHVVATSMFHWYSAYGGQVSGPWIPVEGRKNWSGDTDFWKRMIKQTMAANIDVYYVHLIPHMDQQRINLFQALYELRVEGWDVPKVCPFFDPLITYSLQGSNVDVGTEAGKDELMSHYIRFYEQYYSQNQDEFADDYIYTIDGEVVLDTWHVHINIRNYAQLTRYDVEYRLSTQFGPEHPVFYNGIRMITTALSPTYTFADEKVYQFEVHEYYIEKSHNSVVSAQIKPGYWDQNVRNPGYILPRDGGSKYINAWNQVNASLPLNRVYIESFNEYDEGSGIYATKTDTFYTKTDGGMNNTNSDTWSSTNDPYEYIKTTAKGAAIFNDDEALNAKILWHNIPKEMSRAETFVATIVVRNGGNEQWNNANGFKFGELESLDPVLFGPARYLIDDTQDDIPVYGGIFRGRVKTFQIEVIAPDQSGDYLTHWSMLQEDVAWFGDTIELPISVSQSYHNTETENICHGDSILWHGDYVSQTGSYYDSLLTVSGHDSICQLDLTVITIDPSVTQDEASLTANASDAVYQWIDCATSDPIPGETGQNFVAAENGEYAVIVTKDVCADTSSCYSVTGVGTIDAGATGGQFKTYPNPVSIDGLIRIDGDFRKNDRVVLISIKGHVVYDEEIQSDIKSLNLTPRTYNMKEGVYIIQIISSNHIQTEKIFVGN